MNAFVRLEKQDFYRFIEKQSEGRYEFVRGFIVEQKQGATRRHHEVCSNVWDSLQVQCDESQWNVFQGRGVETSSSVRYPDIVVEPADEPGNSLATTRPRIIVEVLSPSTASTDIDVKPAEYLALGSLDAYVVASQTEPAMLVWQRGKDGTFGATPVEVSGRDQRVVVMTRDFAATLDLGMIYKGIA
jgi:Uma2 family endonuclease